MAFSSLYSAVLRGKWFISFRDVEANKFWLIFFWKEESRMRI